MHCLLYALKDHQPHVHTDALVQFREYLRRRGERILFYCSLTIVSFFMFKEEEICFCLDLFGLEDVVIAIDGIEDFSLDLGEY